MPARDLKQLLRGIEYPGVQVQGLGFAQAPGFGGATPFDNGMFDNIQYDADGLPMLSDSAVDTLIQSNYTDLALGTRPEDIDVVGGAYVDTYSSHAPEEMVPGIVFDTLDMQVYTKINGGADILGYRMFSNMLRTESYLRIADAHTTTLAIALNIYDLNIIVTDASKLPVPNLFTAEPGVVFINGERITYYTIDLITNTLGQIRRGTQGTSTPIVQLAGTDVVDASVKQVVPGTVANVANITVGNNVVYQVTNAPTYNLKLSANVSANVGDVITQTSGSNAMVVGIDTISSDIILVTYNTGAFSTTEVDMQLSGNVTMFAGDLITQASTGANLSVVTTIHNSANVVLRYNGLTTLVSGSGNIAINGVDANTYPVIAMVDPVLTSNIAINGTHIANAYPLATTLHGMASAAGTVTVYATDANVSLHTANVWYNLGGGSATDGTGFEGAITEPVLFLKASTATNTIISAIKDMITTEDAVNILTTEDNKQILED
jgi:hypothetical protein